MERKVRDIERYVGYLETVSQREGSEGVTMKSYLELEILPIISRVNDISEFAVILDTSRTAKTELDNF